MTYFLVVTSNCHGVLARIVSIVSAAGINIDTAAAYPVVDSTRSVVHLGLQASSDQQDRIGRKLSRLVDVLEVRTCSEQATVALGLSKLIPAGAFAAGTSSPAT